MKKSLMFLFTLIMGVMHLRGQQNYEPMVIPPPPDVASLGKFGDVPVSTYTGIPNINIPLYEITNRKLSVPISLSYHAGGIKVEEIASRVGLGWSLSAGGSISRTVRGLPDDLSGVGMLDHQHDYNDIYNMASLPLLDKDLLLNQQNNGNIDLETDIFHFHVNGISGKMFLDKENDEGYPIPYQKLKIEYDRDQTTNAIERFTITGPDGTMYIFGRALTDISRIAIDQQEAMPSGDTPNQSFYTSTWHLVEILSVSGEKISLYYTPYSAYYCQKSNKVKYHKIAQTGTCPEDVLDNNTTLNIEGMVLSEIHTDTKKALFLTSNTDRLDLPKDNFSSHPTDRALEKIEIQSQSGNFIKGFKLKYDYFTSSVTSNYCGFSNNSDIGKRLKLEEVVEIDENDNENSPYEFTYNPSVNLPDRFSDAQDHWGYYNGENGNSTLVPEHLLTPTQLNPILFISGGKRHADPQFVQAGMLTDIKYPTQGITSFIYESHDTYGRDFSFEGESGGMEFKTSVLGADANQSGTNGITVATFSVTGTTPGENALGKIVKVSRWIDLTGSSCTYSDEDEFDECYVNLIIKKQGGTNTYPDANSVMTSLTDYAQDDYYFLENGTYELILEIDPYAYMNTDPEFEHINHVKCEVYANPGNGWYNKVIGGVRIKRIERRVSENDPNPVVTEYEYKQENDPSKSSGVLVSEPYYSYEENDNTTSGCIFLVRKAFSNIPLGTTQGSHIGYEFVQEYQGDNQDNGKTTYEYTTANQYPDQSMESTDNGLFTPLRSYDWKRGLLEKMVEYKSNGSSYDPVREIINTYDIAPYPGLEIKIPGIQFRCAEEASWGCIEIVYERYELVSGWQYLSSTKTRVYDQHDQSKYVETIQRNFYENETHVQLTRTESTNSDGKTSISRYYYPEDYNKPGITYPTAITKMKEERFMPGIAIETINSIKDGNTEFVLGGSYREFVEEPGINTGPAPTAIVPRKVFALETNTPINLQSLDLSIDKGEPDDTYFEPRANYSAYDGSGNLIEFSLEEEHPTTYIWGHNSGKLTASVKDAPSGQVAYTSFESTDKGNWNYNGTPILSSNSKTGRFYHTLSNGFLSTTLGLLPDENSSDYVISYWKQGQAAIVTNSPGPVISLNSGLWTYYEHHISVSSSQTINVSSGMGTNQEIDEVRAYPARAQMSTYCYDEAMRIHTMTDPNGKPVYYEYDDFGRLSHIRDQDGHIIKRMTYNYKNQ